MSSFPTPASRVNPRLPVPAQPARRSAHERGFTPPAARVALQATCYSRVLHDLFTVADQLQDKIEQFVQNHDTGTLAHELRILGAVAAEEMVSEVLFDEVLEPAERTIDDAR